MKQAIKLSLLIFLITALSVKDTDKVSACSCDTGMPLIGHIARSSAIFSGKVVGEEQSSVTNRNSIYTPLLYTFEVIHRWKGVSQRTLTVATIEMCGYSFEVGKEYLVFADNTDGQLYAYLCSRTQELETADQDVYTLNSLFAASPFEPLGSPATITVPGHAVYLAEADQLTVRFNIDKAHAIEVTSQQFTDALLANGITQTLLSSVVLYNEGKAFYLTLRREQLSKVDVATLLEQLTQMQPKLAADSNLPIRQVEVGFRIEDCTQVMAIAQRIALYDAQARATLLAALVGGSADGIMAVADETTRVLSSPIGFGLCYEVSADQWHTLPLKTDLPTAMRVRVPIALSVTFALETVTVSAPASAQPAKAALTATPVSISPLPTPKP